MEAATPQTIFYLFGLPITDTVVSTWVMMLVIIVIAALIRLFKIDVAERIIAMIHGIIASVMPEDTNVMQYLPMLGTLMIFLVFGNIFSVFPMMVSPAANINTTFALSLIVFFAVHVFGIKEKGLWGYFKGLASPIFLLPLEIVSQLSRTLALTIRLFGNIISSDMIVAIVFSLIPFILPLPFIALGLLTGALQAYIFTILASLFIASAIEVESTEDERRRLKQELRQNA
jgi:F-type H+-transporting ATPase subunit a